MVGLGQKLIRIILNFNWYIFSNLHFSPISLHFFFWSWQRKFTRFYICSILSWKINRNTDAILLMFQVSLGKRAMSFHMNIPEPCMSDLNQLQTQMHFILLYLGSCSICFSVKLIIDDYYIILGVVYKRGNPFTNNLFWHEIWIIKQHGKHLW